MEAEDTECGELDFIKHELSIELDGDDLLFKDFKELSGSHTKNRDFKDGLEYLNHLEKCFNYNQEAFIQFLIKILKHLKYHINGQEAHHKLEDRLKRIRRIKAEEQRQDLLTPHFVGRKEVKCRILDKIRNKQGYYVINVYGLGGMGKTTLCNKTCAELIQNEKFKIKKINLREKFSIFDFYEELLTHVIPACVVVRQLLLGMRDDIHTREINYFAIEALKKIEKETIVFLDNIDEILTSQTSEFCSFLMSAIENIDDHNRKVNSKFCRVKFLCTCRQELINHLEALETEKSFYEERLMELEPKEAACLVGKLLQLNEDEQIEEEVNKIALACNNCPLPIKTVCSCLKNGFHRRKFLKSNLSTKGLENCLCWTFQNLPSEECKETLIQLMVFKTSTFDFNTARNVLGYLEEDTCMFFLLLQLHSYCVIEMRQFDQKNPESLDYNVDFSIHPAIHEFLRTTECKKETWKDIITKSKEGFVVYMMGIFIKYQENEKDVLEVARKYSVYIRIFYDIVQEVPDVLSKYNSQTLTFLDRSGIYASIQDGESLKMLSDCAKAYKGRGKLFDYVLMMSYWISKMVDTSITGSTDIIKTTIKEIEDQTISAENMMFFSKDSLALAWFFYSRGKFFSKLAKETKSTDAHVTKIIFESFVLAGHFFKNLEQKNLEGQISLYMSIGKHLKDENPQKCIQYWNLTKGIFDKHPNDDNLRRIKKIMEVNEAIVCIDDAVKRTDENTKLQILDKAKNLLDAVLLEEKEEKLDKTKEYAKHLVYRSNCLQNMAKFDEALEDINTALEILETSINIQNPNTCTNKTEAETYLNAKVFQASLLSKVGNQMEAKYRDEMLDKLTESVDAFNCFLEKCKNIPREQLPYDIEKMKRFRDMHKKALKTLGLSNSVDEDYQNLIDRISGEPSDTESETFSSPNSSPSTSPFSDEHGDDNATARGDNQRDSGIGSLDISGSLRKANILSDTHGSLSKSFSTESEVFCENPTIFYLGLEKFRIIKGDFLKRNAKKDSFDVKERLATEFSEDIQYTEEKICDYFFRIDTQTNKKRVLVRSEAFDSDLTKKFKIERQDELKDGS